MRTPVRAPKANAVCELVGGSLRRECLDFLIPFNERHLHRILREWTTHYNRGGPHSALGPDLPEPTSDRVPPNPHRHRLPIGYRMVKRSVLGGLHHEYVSRRRPHSDRSCFCAPLERSESGARPAQVRPDAKATGARKRPGTAGGWALPTMVGRRWAMPTLQAWPDLQASRLARPHLPERPDLE